MKKFGLEFTKEGWREVTSNFWLMALGSLISVIMVHKYGIAIVFLGSLIVVAICSSIIIPIMLRKKKVRSET